MIQVFDKRVEVTLVDDATGEVTGTRKIAVTDLPDSFLESTTLELGQDSWAVVDADPPFKRLYAESKKLVLRLRPIETIDPQEILYLLPTMSDDLAASEGTRADGSEALLSEDDWRQIELVSRALTPEILQEFNDIKAIREHARQEPGFSQIHVRSRIPNPLDGSTLGLADIEMRFGPESSALRFQDRNHRISDGLRYDLGGNWMLYGTAVGERPRILAIAPSADTPTAPAPHLSDVLNELCREHGLLLVDWCRCRMAEAESVEFAAVFSPMQE